MGSCDAEGFERFSGCWAAKCAQILNYRAPHLKRWRMSGKVRGKVLGGIEEMMKMGRQTMTFLLG